MASKGGIKGFYRQRKSDGISKSKSKASSSSSKKKPSTSFGSDLAQPTALTSHGSIDIRGDYDEHEDMLRQFDLNMAYGPCIGMTRLDRWERANKLGLNPPKDVEDLLKGRKVGLECLWDGRI